MIVLLACCPDRECISGIHQKVLGALPPRRDADTDFSVEPLVGLIRRIQRELNNAKGQIKDQVWGSGRVPAAGHPLEGLGGLPVADDTATMVLQ